MKSYEEITKNLLERRDRYEADKNQKKKKIVSIAAPTCCFAMVSLLVIGVIKNDNKNGDTLIISPADNTQAQTEEKNVVENIIDIFNNDSKETTKANKTNKSKKVEKNNNTKPENTTEALATDDFSEVANDYNSDFTGGKLPPNKDHTNHIQYTQEFSDASTENPYADKFIQRIEVTQLPVKTVYYVGDTFDFRGLEVTGYFSTGEAEDITQDIQIYNTVAYSASNKYRIYIEYTDNSDAINLAYTEFYVNVIEPDIDIAQKSVTLNTGESFINSVITPAKNCVINWYSTDTSVVTVDNNGNITAVGTGNASVYAEISFYGSSTCTFKKESPGCTITVN